MTYNNLIESMEVSAKKRIDEITKKAHQETDEIRRTAEEKADLIKAEYLTEAQKSVEAERNKLIYQAKAESNMRAIKEKEQVIQSAFIEAKKRLEGFRKDSNYEENFKKMLQEAVHALDAEKVVLHIDKRDESLCNQMLNEIHHNSEFVNDLTSLGGLEVSTTDGKIVVFNTIESRLANAEELLRREIFATLYGG
jgi:vacuolar-type H+-ATPase subunit E/Vma4